MLCLLTYGFVLYEIFLENVKELNLNHARLNFLRRTKLANQLSSAILLKHSCCIELIRLSRQLNAFICLQVLCQSSHLTSVHSY
jgi:hypothetical protein